MSIENEENLEEICNHPFLPADHPLLQPMQKAMTKQLERELESHLHDLNKKNKILKTIERETENKGVQLYELQQRLAKLQKTIVKENEETAVLAAHRRQNESRLMEVEDLYQRSKKDVVAARKRLLKTMNELSGLNVKLKNIEGHQEVLTSEIKITRRITYKIEEDIQLVGKFGILFFVVFL